MTAEAAAEQAAVELREERRARREREARVESEVTAAQRAAAAAEAQLEHTRAELADERTRSERAARRAEALAQDLRQARAELSDAVARHERAPSRLDARDAQALADAASATERVAAQLAAIRDRVGRAPAPPSTPPRSGGPPASKPLATRVRPPVPPGVVATAPAGVEAMLRHPGVLLVVDGYNVTKRVWPDASPGEQRERLGVAVTQLHRRFGCEVLCVFDGDGSGPGHTVRRGGVRAVFSDADEEADEVIVREVAARPKRVPVVVVSSDAWVREHAEAEGAVVVPAEDFLRALRPGHAP
jgi:predicted RNA-binding protein with PIN domain